MRQQPLNKSSSVLSTNDNQLGQLINNLQCQQLLDNSNSPYSDSRQIMIDLDATLYPLITAMNRFPGGENCLMENCHSWEQLIELSGGKEKMFSLFE
jgi:hypothetical protein